MKLNIVNAEVKVVKAPEEGIKWALAVTVFDKEKQEYSLGKGFPSKKAADDAQVIVEAVLRTIIYGPDK